MSPVLKYGKPQLLYACLLIMAVSTACHQPEGKAPGTTMMHEGKPQYARGFRIERFAGLKILHVINPWQGSSTVHFQYILSDGTSRIPDSLKEHPVIQVPVKRVICMSTTHVAMIDALGESNAIVGISGSDYITHPDLRSKLEKGEVRDVGSDQTLNYELILTLRPDLVIAYGITAEVKGMVNRLEGLGIPVILNGDYLEDQPLGKTEWIRFLAPFFAGDQKADSVFISVASSYKQLMDLIGDSRQKPSVMTGLPWKDTWYIPGGKSFAAAYIRDAGGPTSGRIWIAGRLSPSTSKPFMHGLHRLISGSIVVLPETLRRSLKRISASHSFSQWAPARSLTTMPRSILQVAMLSGNQA